MNDKVSVKAFDPFEGQSDTNGNGDDFWPIPQVETSFKATDIWHHTSAAQLSQAKYWAAVYSCSWKYKGG